MSSFVTLSVNPATLPALAVLRPIDPAISARFEGERNRTDAQRDAADREGGRIRNAALPQRAIGEARDPGAARPRPERQQFSGRDERHGWPASAFYAQHLAQEASPDDTPALDHAAAAAKYPSLGYDIDIFLPGQPITAPTGSEHRVDIII